MSRLDNFYLLLDPGCKLDKYESFADKITAIVASIKVGAFKAMCTADVLSESLKEAGADGSYGGRDVYEMLDGFRAKALAALHELADDAEIAKMYRLYNEEDHGDA